MGRTGEPIAIGDCVIAEGGRVAAIRMDADLDPSGPDTVFDALGVALAPGLIGANMVIKTGTDVADYINGGHSALADDQIDCLIETCTKGLEIVHRGNERVALLTLNTARELGRLDQIILGKVGQAGAGFQPFGALRMVAMRSSLGNVAPETAFRFGTVYMAHQRELDRGLLEVGKSAASVLMDQAKCALRKDLQASGAPGNLPGVGMTIIDGDVRSMRSGTTPPAQSLPEVVSA
ncbi:MAG: hypothetical protein AAFR47_16555 [Pseudomonadota bacterium]